MPNRPRRGGIQLQECGFCNRVNLRLHKHRKIANRSFALFTRSNVLGEECRVDFFLLACVVARLRTSVPDEIVEQCDSIFVVSKLSPLPSNPRVVRDAEQPRSSFLRQFQLRPEFLEIRQDLGPHEHSTESAEPYDGHEGNEPTT
jgi:hypothetical protein